MRPGSLPQFHFPTQRTGATQRRWPLTSVSSDGVISWGQAGSRDPAWRPRGSRKARAGAVAQPFTPTERCPLPPSPLPPPSLARRLSLLTYYRYPAVRTIPSAYHLLLGPRHQPSPVASIVVLQASWPRTLFYIISLQVCTDVRCVLCVGAGRRNCVWIVEAEPEGASEAAAREPGGGRAWGDGDMNVRPTKLECVGLRMDGDGMCCRGKGGSTEYIHTCTCRCASAIYLLSCDVYE